jgi:hypothetical protein
LQQEIPETTTDGKVDLNKYGWFPDEIDFWASRPQNSTSFKTKDRVASRCKMTAKVSQTGCVFHATEKTLVHNWRWSHATRINCTDPTTGQQHLRRVAGVRHHVGLNVKICHNTLVACNDRQLRGGDGPPC